LGQPGPSRRGKPIGGLGKKKHKIKTRSWGERGVAVTEGGGGVRGEIGGGKALPKTPKTLFVEHQ